MIQIGVIIRRIGTINVALRRFSFAFHPLSITPVTQCIQLDAIGANNGV